MSKESKRHEGLMFVLKYVLLPLVAIVATFYVSQAGQDRETGRIRERVSKNEERQKAFEDTTREVKAQMVGVAQQVGKVDRETVRISAVQSAVKEDVTEIKRLLLDIHRRGP